MNHFLSISKALLLGFLIAQVLSTLQVYASNLGYYTFLTSVREAGYLAVPNEYVFSTLRDFGPAFCGGLFFTLTAGAALTIISSGLAWAWDRLFSRNRIVLLLLSLLLLLCLLAAKIRGFSPLITGYLLFIPSLVFGFTLRWLPKQPKNQSHKNILFPVIAFLMLPLILIVWRPSDINEDRFLDVRDYLLLSNSFGRKVNAFYYENSLYATRVLRSYGQQVIRSCSLEGVSDPLLGARITQVLLSRDYLPLENAARADLRVAASGQDLEFYDQDEWVLKTSVRDFFRNPAEPLKEFEKRTERHRFLLVFTMFSILFLGALLLFACFYTPFYLLSGLFLKSTPRAVKAGILWPVAFFLMFLAFRGSNTEDLSDPENLSTAMASDRLHARITALKYILRNKIDIAGFQAYPSMLNSPHIPERYWLAKALGISRTPETRKSLYRLLDDPHFNVVCMAIDSLGRRGNRPDIPLILSKIETSHNWYEQWYAYRALRRLGWRQKGSNEEQHM
jgi:Ca2+/Na+ antiporter